MLHETARGDEPNDSYTFDPRHPAPTAGGNFLGPGAGVRDQAAVEARADVLVYKSAALAAPLEVTGHVHVTLFASSSARDTDFTAKLVDIEPGGYVRNICDGMIRGRYRHSRARQELLDPGTVYEFTIDLLATSYVFQRGHRIGLEISSSNFPRFDRNPGTGSFIPTEPELRPALQSVFHSTPYPSHITLPVVVR
jgi:putative CocE/NonD family hydrolase